ncbi:MAG: protein phosphatase 2C domain-containing protein [Gammaproteobacteria bacterium]|nr:protein phosphatase 2C domain-containing protein [Gammaproteobacteria bacterium]
MANGNVTQPSGIEMVGMTDPGLHRDTNEDAYALLPGAGIALLADGMGGHARGELASTIAVSRALRHLVDAAPGVETAQRPPRERLAGAVDAANRAVLGAAGQDPASRGMGTTLIAVLFEAGWLHAVHVGDSRLYRYRGETLEQLTHDQTVGAMLAARARDRGDPHRPPPFSNVLTQAIGADEEMTPERIALECHAGDLYLLCSDGLYSMLEESEIRLTLQKFDANLGATARELIRLANNRGGLDNITTVLARPAYQI